MASFVPPIWEKCGDGAVTNAVAIHMADRRSVLSAGLCANGGISSFGKTGHIIVRKIKAT